LPAPRSNLPTTPGASRPRRRAARILLTLAIVGVAAPIAIPATSASAVVSPPTGWVTEFPAARDPSGLWSSVIGPDDNMWFGESTQNNIASVTNDGAITEYLVPGGLNSGGSSRTPTHIVAAADGKLWFTEVAGGNSGIGSITTSGVVTQYPLSNDHASPYALTNGPDGNIWFSEEYGNKIGRVTSDGTITEYALPTNPEYVFSITAGSDGNVWFTVYGGRIGRITRLRQCDAAIAKLWDRIEGVNARS
jgi:streptogramin lyase